MRRFSILVLPFLLLLTAASVALAQDSKTMSIYGSFCPGVNDYIQVVPGNGTNHAVMTGAEYCNNVTDVKHWTTQIWYGYNYASSGTDFQLVAKHDLYDQGVVWTEDTIYQCVVPDSRLHYWEFRTTFQGGYRLTYGQWLYRKIAADGSCSFVG